MLESIGGTNQLNKLRCDYSRVLLKPAVLKIWKGSQQNKCRNLVTLNKYMWDGAHKNECLSIFQNSAIWVCVWIRDGWKTIALYNP